MNGSWFPRALGGNSQIWSANCAWVALQDSYDRISIRDWHVVQLRDSIVTDA